MKKSTIGVLAALALLATGCSSPSASEASGEFPDHQIDVVIAFGPGGTNDVLARRTATHLEDALGVPVAVENREGGGGAVGTTYAANEPADGYTLVTWSPPG